MWLLLAACAGPDARDAAPADTGPVDADGDGVVAVLDCDDGDATVSPLAPEVPYDGVDQDCDGADLTDVDGDGWDVASDCDDADPRVNPDRREVCGDATDDDCDGVTACPDTGEADDTGRGDDTAPLDSDGDGVPAGADCDDADPDVYPGAPDRVGGDRDCDGDASRLGADDAWIVDGACSAAPGRVSGGGDLDGDGVADAAWTRGACGAETGGAITLFFADDFATGTALASASAGATGFAVDARGDLDGDGVDDLVYAPLHGGDVSLLRGGELSTADLGAPDARIEQDGAYWRVRTADLDGDGVSDLLVDELADLGATFLFYGGVLPEGALGDADARLVATSPDGTNAGRLLALAADDLDGDGVVDLAVGTRPYFGDGAGVIPGGPSRFSGSYTLADAARRFVRSDGGDLGDAIAACDLDADGVSDLVLGGSDGLYAFGPGAGTSSEADAWATLAGDTSALQDGLACDDVDRDGIADILVGVPYWSERAESEGVVFRLAGPLTPGTGALSDGTRLAATWGHTLLGWSLATSGDHVLVTAAYGADDEPTAPLWVLDR